MGLLWVTLLNCLLAGTIEEALNVRHLLQRHYSLDIICWARFKVSHRHIWACVTRDTIVGHACVGVHTSMSVDARATN